MRYVWDEAKRKLNLEKHGLDFIDSDLVITSAYRLDVFSTRRGEQRVQSFSYVFEALTVMTVVHVPGVDEVRIISFRRANRSEREAYHDWLENYGNDD